MKNPIVTMEFENGNSLQIELYPKIAPNTVANFISLVKSGFYDGLTFHLSLIHILNKAYFKYILALLLFGTNGIVALSLIHI